MFQYISLCRFYYSLFIALAMLLLINVSVVQANRQIFRGDIVINAGENFEGDLLVYSGDITVVSQSKILGNLTAYDGNVFVGAETDISGNVTVFSGDIQVAGNVQGNITAWRGDITLKDTAHIHGNVNLWSGTIEQSDGAKIEGQLVSGLRIPLQTRIGSDDRNGQAVSVVAGRYTIGSGGLLAIIVRLASAIGLTSLATIVAAALTQTRPNWFAIPQHFTYVKGAQVFGLGLAANLILLGLIALFRSNILLSPLALLLLVAFCGLNIAGWAITSRSVGQRLIGQTSVESQKNDVLNTFVIAIISFMALMMVAIPWIVGGPLRFISYAAFLALFSFGCGTTLLPYLFDKRH